MFFCRKLKSSCISYFRELNENRNLFNELNENFFDLYDNVNFIEKKMLMKNVILLQDILSTKYVGYIWMYNLNRYNKKIKAINVIDEFKYDLNLYKQLIDTVEEESLLRYKCKENEYNFNILCELGFKKSEDVLELEKRLDEKDMDFILPNDINIKQFIKNKDENLRCFIQNSIFENINRIPLTIKDLDFERRQEYFQDNSSFFLNLKNETIGYGQIINDDNIQCIVNFGIIPKYRGKGYSKYLLKYLLKNIYERNFTVVKIKVESKNSVAVNLYKSFGFKVKSNICRWTLLK